MRHEVLDKLVEKCGGPSKTRYTAIERDIMDVWMKVWAVIDPQTREDFDDNPPAMNLAVLILKPAIKLLPSEEIRKELVLYLDDVVEDARLQMGGCDSERMERLINNLAAIAIMGPVDTPEASLERQEINAARDGVNCFYDDPERDNYQLAQYHKLALLLDWASTNMMMQGGDDELRRLHCPSVPDFRFEIYDVRLHIEPDLTALPQGDRAVRLATAFFDQYIPEYVQRPDGSPISFSSELKERYFDAIVEFERIDIEEAAIEQELAQRLKDMQERRPPSGSPYRAAVEVDLRLAAYRTRYGTKIWDVMKEFQEATGTEHGNYLMTRMGGADFFDQIQ